MGFLLWSSKIPVYDESQSLEDAWTALMNTMLSSIRAELFFSYPEPGNGHAKWQPSWDQVMTTSLPRAYRSVSSMGVQRDAETNVDLCQMTFCIESGFVRGLAEGGALGSDQYGDLLIEDACGIQHAFPIIATHQYPIPEGRYTLIRNKFTWGLWAQWVVGQRLSDERFEKPFSV